MNDIVMWDDKHRIVEARLCRIISVDNQGKSTFEKDCTECKHCRLGEYTMCSDGNERRFSTCMAKGEPYTILFDYGRCELFTDKENEECGQYENCFESAVLITEDVKPAITVIAVHKEENKE